MAFDPLQFSLFVGANGNSIWYYKSATDTHTQIIAANYFGPYGNVVNPGDMIIVHDSAGTNDILFVKTTDGLFAVTVAAALSAPVMADAGEGTQAFLAAEKAKAKAQEAAAKGDTGLADQEPRDETPAEMRRREKQEEEQRQKREDEQNHRPPHRR